MAKPATKRSERAPRNERKPETTGEVVNLKAQDQSDAKVQDQNSAPGGEKKKRKFSDMHKAWVAQPKFPVTAKITFKVEGNPKRGKQAPDRYALYKNGMTVQEYIDAFKAKSWPEALAHADIRWDFVHGYINVV